jgi:hypothetical protein
LLLRTQGGIFGVRTWGQDTSNSDIPKAVGADSGATGPVASAGADLQWALRSGHDPIGSPDSLEARIYIPLGVGAFPVLFYFNTGCGR